jgi:hypothetical protein
MLLCTLLVALVATLSSCRYKDAIEALYKGGTTSSGVGTGKDINVTGTWRLEASVDSSTSGKIVARGATLVWEQSGTVATCTSIKWDPWPAGVTSCTSGSGTGCSYSGVVVGNTLTITNKFSEGVMSKILTGESHKLTGKRQSAYTSGICDGNVVRSTLTLNRTSTSTTSVAAYLKEWLRIPLQIIGEAVAQSTQGSGYLGIAF